MIKADRRFCGALVLGLCVVVLSASDTGAQTPQPPLCESTPADQCIDVRIDPSSGPPGTVVTVEAVAAGCQQGGTLWVYPEGGGLDAANFYFQPNGPGTSLGSVGASPIRTTWTVQPGTVPAFWVGCNDITYVGSFENFGTIEETTTLPEVVVAPTTPGATAPLINPGATGTGSAVPHDRGSFAAALRAPDDVSTDPGLLFTNVLLAVMMVLLVFPAELFNATLEEHYDEVVGWVRGPRRVLHQIQGRFSGQGATVGFVVVTAATAVLYAFLDPDVSLDSATIATVIGVGLAIATGVLIGGLAARRLLRKTHSDDGALKVYPAALVVGLVCVLISRVADFQPGYLYGIVAGFAFTSSLTKADEGRAAAIAGLAGLGASVAAWFAWMPVRDAVDGADPNFVLLVLDAYLAAMFVAGLQALVFGFIPIRYLPGAKVWSWSKLVWIGLFGLGALGFMHVLLHPDSAYDGSVTTMIVLFVVFALASGAFWAYFRYRSPREPRDDPAAPATV